MKKSGNIIDISLSIHKSMITYPGYSHPKIKHKWWSTTADSEITLSSHTGTHVTSPRHLYMGTRGVDSYPLKQLVGPCRVVNFSRVRKVITMDDLRSVRIKQGERILAKTSNSKRGFRRFYGDYVTIDGDAADFLAKKKISLFGIDALSVAKNDEADLRAYTSLLKKNIVIVEGLNLEGVSAGKYTLVVLPLSFRSLDGAPARAVLMKKSSS
ncbi:MAG: cyclase family protein [bacterium]|nr:cyclase family protein [bacterium]